jgi:hypothetical protein
MSKCVDSVLSTIQECKSDQDREILARRIFKQTFIPIDVDENTTPENLHLTCTGAKLRFEIIGVIIVYYVMGCLVTDLEQIKLVAEQGGQYLLELTHASNQCVSFCDRAESLNDILLWLLHANVILLTFQYGEASKLHTISTTSFVFTQIGHLAWRRTGDLASTVFALGIHQEPSSHVKLPFFVLELRRHIFCNAYSTDKALSTFFGRPPRISKRYCSTQPPHDLTDDEIIAPEDIRNLALSKLDANGWNTQGLLCRSTWGRIKWRINIIREETLELSLGPPRADDQQRIKVQAVLDRAKAMYQSIPAFARYNDGIWSSGLAGHSCFTLLYYYLNWTYSEFLLLRMLARIGGASWDAVYESALSLLNGVLNLSKYRDRIGAMSRDFAWVSIFYGLPPSALLAIELLRQQQASPGQPQVRLPRAEIIRNISVFISSLEWVAKPDDGNYDLCQGARQLLDSILNAILDSHPASSEQTPQPAPADPVMWLDDMFGGGWMTSGTFVNSIGMDYTQSWEPAGNWPFEY